MATNKSNKANGDNTKDNNDRSEEKEIDQTHKDLQKEEIMAELKDELLTEMKSKNEELLSEINKLKTELRDLSTKKQNDATTTTKKEKNKNKNKKKPKKSNKKKKKKHRAAESLHNEWPKLNVKDRASLRRKLAKEISAHHNIREKKKFKLEKSLIKKEKKLEKYRREIFKLEAQLAKHGVKYVGPPSEDRIYGLLCCMAYKSILLSSSAVYERRYSIAHSAVQLEQRQVQRKWAELFTDLIFVAIIVKFASQINSQYIHYSREGDVVNMFHTLLNGLLFFIPFWCLWLELTMTLIRFHDFEGKWYGLVDDTLIFIMLAGVIEISFQIDINADLFGRQYAHRFLLGFGLCIVALLLLHIFYRWKLKATAARYCRRRIASYSFALLLLIVLPFVCNIIVAIMSSCCVMLYVSLVSFRVHPSIIHSNKHIESMYSIYCLESIVERFGIFSMIVIGESILALLISPDPGSFIRYICVYFAFALLYLFQLMYFSSHAQEACHALNKLSSPGAVAWIAWHLPLSSSLLFVGIGLRLLVTFADLDSIPPQISIVLVVATCATITNYYILRSCHDKFISNAVSLCLRSLPIIVCPAVLLTDCDSFGIILWCSVCTIASCFFDMILIAQYETKPIWIQHHHHHHAAEGEEHSAAQFHFHPEEYNPIYLPYDSWLFCRNYDGEHGRTMVVTLAEYIIDDQTLRTIHEIEESIPSIAVLDNTPTQPGIHVAHQLELSQNMPTSPSAYIGDRISHTFDLPSLWAANTSNHHDKAEVSLNPSVIIHKTPDIIGPQTPMQTPLIVEAEAEEEEEVSPYATIQLHPPVSSKSHTPNESPFRMTRSRSHEPNNAAIIDWDSWLHEIEAEAEEDEEHRHQWLSEFADLVFVAIIINFADQIKNMAINECVSSDDNSILFDACLTRLLGEAAVFFSCFFTIWYELSVTLIRFSSCDSVADDCLKFVYLGGIVTMTLQMSKDEFLSCNISGFMTGCIVCLLCMTLLHIIYYFNVQNCQLYCRTRCALYCVSISCLFAASLYDNASVSLATCGAVSATILWISSNSFRVILTPNDELLELPQDVFEHTVERWGVFVMIATGESILALIATTNKLDANDRAQEEDIAFQHYIAILCAFGITYLVSHYYLESSKINSMHFHALMHPGSPGSVLWTTLHGVLAFCLMCVGAGWKLLLLSLSAEICWIDAEKYYIYATKQSAQYVEELRQECCHKYHIPNCSANFHGWIEFSLILGASLTASLITMYLLRTSHPKFIFSWKSIICRFPIIFIIPCGAYWTNQFETQSFYYSVWCLILMTISYFVDHLFIDIYQSDIKPELRTFYDTQIAPELRQQTLQLHLMESKRKSLEFGRSTSLTNLNKSI
eukprot:251799_1